MDIYTKNLSKNPNNHYINQYYYFKVYMKYTFMYLYIIIIYNSYKYREYKCNSVLSYGKQYFVDLIRKGKYS